MTIDILILDDSHDKVSAISRELVPLLGEGVVRITTAPSSVQGRELMMGKTYDLLILDMVMPEHDDEEPSRTAGADFLDEINESGPLQQPIQIIGLTEYESEYNDLQQQFKDRLWYLLFYSRSRQEWKKQLRRKVQQLAKMKQDLIASVENRSHYDIAIICALGEEQQQLERAFEDCEWQDVRLPGLPYAFRSTVVNTPYFHQYTLIAACADRAGVTSTAVLATALYTVCHVDAIFMTGITAGIQHDSKEPTDRLNLDDVIIAGSVLSVPSGKLIEDDVSGGDLQLLKEIDQIPADHSLISSVSALIRDTQLCEEINEDARDASIKLEDDPDSRFRIAKTVCVPVVMESPSLIAAMKDDDRKLQALDMEGYGLYLTAHTLHARALWIKGVSDFADRNKNDSRHPSAAYLSARFLYTFLREKYAPNSPNRSH